MVCESFINYLVDSFEDRRASSKASKIILSGMSHDLTGVIIESPLSIQPAVRICRLCEFAPG
ncbi:hypothetical protein RB9176 [Rhodopirellula baltica SH 1]|uniref:Uncharacterized protein n=1 Tax=Rhodopirellula baltica (strain DSM 10527 / NCIMB 13988 / SH1) TaxID=243090 RepID=Q7ULZ3_RHOBA|nr:hypothetical protein RB9176 [Rhodopirellula baltica SH 1]